MADKMDDMESLQIDDNLLPSLSPHSKQNLESTVSDLSLTPEQQAVLTGGPIPMDQSHPFPVIHPTEESTLPSIAQLLISDKESEGHFPFYNCASITISDSQVLLQKSANSMPVPYCDISYPWCQTLLSVQPFMCGESGSSYLIIIPQHLDYVIPPEKPIDKQQKMFLNPQEPILYPNR